MKNEFVKEGEEKPIIEYEVPSHFIRKKEEIRDNNGFSGSVSELEQDIKRLKNKHNTLDIKVIVTFT